ncbi:MAG: holo-ACP synthase [Helicobacter sp.]|nr:holo-ACP synthase [Helicobacter sp.]MDE7216563.1 holo-ACP synthase [Helicobacter sp.]MDE7254756.1 holo-ACP synthase [Helicobacter sp.]
MTALGIDIVSINRVETFVARWHTRALERFLTKHEISLYAGNVQRIASAWAAKEAFSKALGCGIGAQCSFVDIMLMHDERGQPSLNIAPELVQRFGIEAHSLSISHDGGFVIAAVIVQLESPPQ